MPTLSKTGAFLRSTAKRQREWHTLRAWCRNCSHHAEVKSAVWGNSLSKLSAPLGCHAILGNHDWWHDVDSVRAALVDNGIPVLENTATLIRPQDGPAFWLAGLGDQWAKKFSRGVYKGVDDLPGTMAGIPDDGNPILLLAHEPDIFITVPDRVSLTLCGHTHGGQVRLPFIGPHHQFSLRTALRLWAYRRGWAAHDRIRGFGRIVAAGALRRVAGDHGRRYRPENVLSSCRRMTSAVPERPAVRG